MPMSLPNYLQVYALRCRHEHIPSCSPLPRNLVLSADWHHVDQHHRRFFPEKRSWFLRATGKPEQKAEAAGKREAADRRLREEEEKTRREAENEKE